METAKPYFFKKTVSSVQALKFTSPLLQAGLTKQRKEEQAGKRKQVLWHDDSYCQVLRRKQHRVERGRLAWWKNQSPQRILTEQKEGGKSCQKCNSQELLTFNI